MGLGTGKSSEGLANSTVQRLEKPDGEQTAWKGFIFTAVKRKEPDRHETPEFGAFTF